MRRTRLLALFVAFGFLTSCSGELLLPLRSAACTTANCACETDADCAEFYDCASHVCTLTTCSPFTPAGLCPAGRECTQGVCVASGQGAFCDCLPEEACSSGTCYAITEDNQCSTARTTGLCPMGSVCIGGVCEEINNSTACSPTLPTGLCQAGATCVDGYCMPIAEDACSAANQDGRCYAGMICVAPGVCDYLPCSVDTPWGRCDPGQYCSSASHCVALGVCDSNADCDLHYICDGAACIRDLSCGEDDDCLSTEHCVASGTCMAKGACVVTADCNADQICSTLEHCIAAGSCETEADCISPERCGSDKTCMGPGECASALDCAPGHSCQSRLCVATARTCTANAVTPTQGCLDSHTCCPEGQRCSLPEGLCIFDGQCLNNDDCLAGAMACGDDYRCQYTDACNGGDCDTAETCSYGGGCVPTGNCGIDGDCPTNSVCSSDWTCQVSGGCGSTEFQTTLVKPNMLIVLDHSGSMSAEDFGDPAVARWDAAREALYTVLGGQDDTIRFGLSVFSGAANSCTPGDNNVGIDDNQGPTISSLIEGMSTGGNTPAGPTLRAIAENRSSFGLDDTTRGNYVLFVTDGEPNCDPIPVYDPTKRSCQRDPTCCECYRTGSPNRTAGAIDMLYDASPQIRTYVIGIKLASTSLDCFAVYGGTSQCGTQVQKSSCTGTPQECTCTGSATTPKCYFPADNMSELEAAFATIVGEVASCAYNLDTVPPDINLLYVYMRYGSESPIALAQDPTNGWTYDASTNQVTFNGTSCDDLSSGSAQPYIVYGCPSGG